MKQKLTFTEVQVKEVTSELEIGMRAFIHLKTGELLFLPQEDMIREVGEESWREELNKFEEESEEYFEIEPMSSREGFRVMEDFAKGLDNSRLKERLLQALDKPKPFRQFVDIIRELNEERDMWFKFKTERYEDWTRKQLENPH